MNERGLSTVGVVVFLALLVAVGVFAGPAIQTKWAETQTAWDLRDAAQDGVVAANAAVKAGRDPVRAVRELSTDAIDVRAKKVGVNDYCVTATYLKRDVVVEPVRRGSC